MFGKMRALDIIKRNDAFCRTITFTLFSSRGISASKN